MYEYISEIEKIASTCTCSEAMKEEQKDCLGYQAKEVISTPQFD